MPVLPPSGVPFDATRLTRRGFIATGIAGGLALTACGQTKSQGTGASAQMAAAIAAAEAVRPHSGRTVSASLTPQLAEIDLGGPVVRTMAYGNAIPGPLIRAKIGDELVVAVSNRLDGPTSTTTTTSPTSSATSTTPTSSATSTTATSGMSGNGGGSSDLLGGDAGDIDYPYYLINGRIPAAPTTFSAKPGQRIRIRFINTGSDTAFRVALAGHSMTVTHTDGFPVVPTRVDALLIGMAERYDVLVPAAD